MQKLLVIIRSEFLRRVKSKWFILSTLLGPLTLASILAIVIYVSIRAVETVDTRNIAVVDEPGVLFDRIADVEDEAFVLVRYPSEDSTRAGVVSGAMDGYLMLPPGVLAGAQRPAYFSVESTGFVLEGALSGRIGRAVREHRIEGAGVSPEIQDIFSTDVSIDSVKLSTEGELAGSSFAYMGLGFMMVMLIYGTVVMYGVIEEKSSRVVEVIVSSVRPFELLMGKVLGTGAMGLVQIITWAVLILGGIAATGLLVGALVDPAALDLPDAAGSQAVMEALNLPVLSIAPGTMVWFVLYFLMGYLLYAGLFAAVGAMVEQQQETQGWLLPVMMPIILSIVFLSPVLQNPQFSLAVTLSLIPFTAPVPMVVRLAVAQVPLWQLLLSFGLLTVGFLGTIWVCSRIYRVGILMYGKKTNLKDLMRWLRNA